ncbi:MAG: LytTR family DNA-binding domain-containing protein [Balneolales bacterium]|nr:LytTR family DNA-binding domain-containing protein [Balneolales bacterium]
MKTVLIDDNSDNLLHLRTLLTAYSDRIRIVGEASSVAEGLKTVKNTQPDLLFLDVELGDGTGFDLLGNLSGFEGMVVFATAFGKYAIRAFKLNAVDYLLKPVLAEELELTISKITEWAGVLKENEGFRKLYRKSLLQAANQHKSPDNPDKIVISSHLGMEMIETKGINFIEADNTYSHVHLKEGRKVTASRPLIEFEDILDPSTFFRIHRSYLLNVEKLKRFLPKEARVELQNGTSLPVSRRKSSAFSSYLKQMNRN